MESKGGIGLIKITIELPDGQFFAGYGLDLKSAFEDAKKHFELSKIPRVGPGIWEQKGGKTNG